MIKKSALWLLIAALSVTLTGCPPGIEADSGETGDPYSASGTRPGHNGGQITVVVTMDTTYTTITNVQVTVNGNPETPGVGSLAVNQIPPKMVTENKIDVDVITNATITSNAIKEAAQDAYNILMTRKSP
jgi:fumarate reductase flavoprotein subunit